MQADITSWGTRHKPLAATRRAGWMLEPGLADSRSCPSPQKPLPRVGGTGSAPAAAPGLGRAGSPAAPAAALGTGLLCRSAGRGALQVLCAGLCADSPPPLLLDTYQDRAAGSLRPVDGDRPRAAPADCEPSAPLACSPGKCATAAGVGAPSTLVWHSCVWQDPCARAALRVSVCAAPALAGAAVRRDSVYGKRMEGPLVITNATQRQSLRHSHNSLHSCWAKAGAECGGRGNPLDVTRAAAPAFLLARGSDIPWVTANHRTQQTSPSIASAAGAGGKEKGRER